jgi:hypothetical protein
MEVRMPQRAEVAEQAVNGLGRMTSYRLRAARRASMNVTIVGAGNMGRGIGHRLVAGGHAATQHSAKPTALRDEAVPENIRLSIPWRLRGHRSIERSHFGMAASRIFVGKDKNSTRRC